MAREVLALRDFPPFVRFELEESYRRKIFAAFANRVGEAEVGIHPEMFWRSVEEEFDRSRYELIFGSLSGTVLKTLERGPLEAKELLERNPELSPYSIYHALVKLKHKKLIHKKDGRWELIKGYFDHLRVSELAKIIDLRQKGCRRKNALSITDVQMATYLWPEYERACDCAGTPPRSASYGKYYEDHFALARAVKEWARGDTNIPQWALVAIADLAGVDSEEREAIVNYALPPGVKITPYYKGRYKLPIEISADFDLLALQILMKSSESGLVHPVKRKKELVKRLYHTFGSFQSDRIPRCIREVIAYYYDIPGRSKSAVRIPERMKERWKKLPDHEQTITKILVLELLFNLDYRKRTYELISRSKDFLEDVSGIIRDLGVGDITIRKRKDRPHYRSYLPKKVANKLKELKENVEKSKIEKGVEFLDEPERKELIRGVKKLWGENGVNIISSLAMAKGVRDLDLARASGVTPQAVRRLLYELEDRAIITHLREETPELVEYYYYLNPDGIKRFLGEHKMGETGEQEKVQYPFPEELALYQRRRLYSGVG
jgi:hypothetical protein